MPDSGSILIRHGDQQALVAIGEWSFRRSGGSGRYACTFRLPWTTDKSIDIILGARLIMAGKRFTITHIEKVEQWDGYEVAVETFATEVENDA